MYLKTIIGGYISSIPYAAFSGFAVGWWVAEPYSYSKPIWYPTIERFKTGFVLGCMGAIYPITLPKIYFLAMPKQQHN
jgi:hypothetical protein